MSGRWLLRSHIRGVAIGAIACLLKLLELFLDGRDFRVGRLLVVLVTGDAGSDRHIRSQSPQAACAGDVDMTGSAFHNVFTLAAFMTEHH